MKSDCFKNQLFDSYRKQIKRKKISIFWNKAHVSLCIFNFILAIHNLIAHFKGWYIPFYITLIVIWILAIYFTKKTIKIQKSELKIYIEDYYNQLKFEDMSAYLKETRIKKLKKLKKLTIFNQLAFLILSLF